MSLFQSPLPRHPMLSNLFSGKFSNSRSATMTVKHNFHNNLTNCPTGSKLRVAYQGVPGAYGEAVQCDKFKDAFQAAGETGLADVAVVPIENSIGGSIHTNYDLLLQHGHGLHIVGETHLLINHCLLALPAVSIYHLKSVFSHPQALDQCKISLAKLGVVAVPADNTAIAAKIVASQGIRENGAVASARAAQLYGLRIIAEKFQDQSCNVTRFLQLARNPIIPTNDTCYKTSIAFTLEGPQELYKALSVFALRHIHLSKIESRPQGNQPFANGFKNGSNTYFKYAFIVEFEASVAEPSTQSAIEHLQELASSVRILGCYPIDATAYIQDEQSIFP